MASKIPLPNGCCISQISTIPKNWRKATKKSLSLTWKFQYYFYDSQGNRKRVVRKGFNRLENLSDRKELMRFAIKDEMAELEKGWNPILKQYVSEIYGEVNPRTPLIEALRYSLKQINGSDKYIKEMDISINRLEKNLFKMRFNPTISEVSRKDFKRIFSFMNLTPSVFNKYRIYYKRLFDELIEFEIIEYNPIDKIKKEKEIKRIRETLTKDEFECISDYLKKESPEFYRFMMIFRYSGARVSELLRLKKKDVNLEEQEYKCTILKGNKPFETIKVILYDVLPYWKELYNIAKPNDYLFGYGLIPNSEPLKPNAITLRWRRLVKQANTKKGQNRKPRIRLRDKNGKPLTITADFYSLKHSLLDELDDEMAKKIASHKSMRTTEVYQVYKEKREREALKKIRLNQSSENLICFNDLISDFNLN